MTMTTDDQLRTFEWSAEDAAKLTAAKLPNDRPHQIAATVAELTQVRDRIRGGFERIGPLVSRLASGEPGELTAEDVALVVDCLNAEALSMLVSDLSAGDPFPGLAPDDLFSLDLADCPAFTARDLPRLQRLRSEVT